MPGGTPGRSGRDPPDGSPEVSVAHRRGLQHAGDAERRDLIEARSAVDDERAGEAEREGGLGDEGQSFRGRRRRLRRVAPAGFASGPTRFIDRRNPQLARRAGPTCRMAGCIRGANMKTMPDSAKHGRHRLDWRFERNAERFEHVGAAAAGGVRAVAVLRDADAGSGSHECRGGRDVERGHDAATRPTVADERVRSRDAATGSSHRGALERRPPARPAFRHGRGVPSIAPPSAPASTRHA